jgi:uncharacterized protein
MPELYSMQTVLITGGTGMIGRALTSHLVNNNYHVIILTRKKRSPEQGVTYATWDVERSVIDEQAVLKADHIVHLAGEGIADKRWTKKRKKAIVDSRVKSGGLLLRVLSENQHKVKTIVSASGIGWYGPDKADKKPFTEDDPHSNDFLGQTCRLWQDSLSPASQLGIRTIFLRTGIVLSKKGGAFPEFVKPLKAGIATIFGDGEQAVSWIHVDDLARLYLFCIEQQQMNGVYNAAAPDVVSNKEMILTIAKTRGKPFIPVHVPVFMLQLALGELSVELLKSTTADDSKVRRAGFQFVFPTLDAAVNDLIRPQ